jgi:hypothetical protein
MLANVYMIFLFDFSSEYKVKITHFSTRVLNNLSFKIESKLALWVKSLCFFILNMQFREESAFEQVWNLVSLFSFNFLS